MTMTAAALAAAGCSSPSPASRLVAAGPDGYRLDTSASQDQLSAASVAQVTPADPDLTKATLKRNGFTGASSRIWKASTGEFLLDLAVRFHQESGAKAFMSFELAQIGERVRSAAPTASERQAGIYPDPRFPDAKVFLLGGPNRQTGDPLFIEGEAFVVGTTAYLVETGGPMPNNADVAQRFGREQMSVAGEQS